MAEVVKRIADLGDEIKEHETTLNSLKRLIDEKVQFGGN